MSYVCNAFLVSIFLFQSSFTLNPELGSGIKKRYTGTFCVLAGTVIEEDEYDPVSDMCNPIPGLLLQFISEDACTREIKWACYRGDERNEGDFLCLRLGDRIFEGICIQNGHGGFDTFQEACEKTLEEIREKIQIIWDE